jgi:hypothetical protein
MKRGRGAIVDIERRLFEISLGHLRLLDTTLDKAGHPEMAELLRELIMGWRAYPSLSVFSREDLRGFSKKLDQIAAGLRATSHCDESEFVLEVMRELKSWIRAAR